MLLLQNTSLQWLIKYETLTIQMFKCSTIVYLGNRTLKVKRQESKFLDPHYWYHDKLYDIET